MLDHIFITVSDINRSVAFYKHSASRTGRRNRHDYEGSEGPSGHPDLKGFGANGRIFFWLDRAHPPRILFILGSWRIFERCKSGL